MDSTQSQLSYLRFCNKIVLSPGHGSIDVGATNGNNYERDEVRIITSIIADNLRRKGLSVDVFPESVVNGQPNADAVLNAQIAYANTYPAYDQSRGDNAWLIQIHRDGAGVPLDIIEASNRMGCFYQDGGVDSQNIASSIVNILKREGANDNSWVRSHLAPDRNLGWFRETHGLTHLIENGFMEGRNDNDWLMEVAKRSSIAIFETFTGVSYNQNPQPPTPPATEIPGSLSIDFKIQLFTELKKSKYFYGGRETVFANGNATYWAGEYTRAWENEDKLQGQLNQAQNDINRLQNTQGNPNQIKAEVDRQVNLATASIVSHYEEQYKQKLSDEVIRVISENKQKLDNSIQEYKNQNPVLLDKNPMVVINKDGTINTNSMSTFSYSVARFIVGLIAGVISLGGLEQYAHIINSPQLTDQFATFIALAIAALVPTTIHLFDTLKNRVMVIFPKKAGTAQTIDPTIQA